MAATPDPSTFASAAQIFSSNYSLPQIRSMHNTLQVQIEEKSNRLRTQVGSSYRELLSTADTIVQMRDDNEQLQSLLGLMGERCGRSILTTKVSGLAEFVSKQKSPAVAATARLKLLDGCILMIGRSLKAQDDPIEDSSRGDRLVLAAKLWILGRILCKGLGDDKSQHGVEQFVTVATKSLSSLRRRILASLDKVFEQPDENAGIDDLLKSLCAYSLISNSGARDVLRHFLSVRSEALALAFDLNEDERLTTADDVIRGVTLYTKTLLDVQALVPSRLGPALAELKRLPLLADPSLRRLDGIRLDVYGRWCSEEIRYFTPFIRHDDLDGKQAREMLSGWVKTSGRALLDGLQKTLKPMVDLKSITTLRTQVLQLWIREGSRAKGFDPTQMSDDLRAAINSRMLAVLENKVAKLHLIGSEIGATLENWQEGVTDKHVGLWEEDGYDAALDNGATSFLQEVASRLYGRGDAVSRVAHSYMSWYHVIDDVCDVVEQLKSQRWDNDYEEIEDEETIAARQQTLSRDDPERLWEKLEQNLDKSFHDLEDQISASWREKSEGSTKAAIAIYLIRVLREIRSKLPQRPAAEGFGLDIVPVLHKTMVIQVSASTLDYFATRWLPERTVVGRLLWEGEPPLPSQPSPGLFRFLHDLTRSMSEAGLDLWSAAAVAALKSHLREQVCTSWRAELSGLPSDEAAVASGNAAETPAEAGDAQSGETAAEETGELMEPSSVRPPGDLFTQWTFDVALLRCFLGAPSGPTSDELGLLEGEMKTRAGLDDASRQRISRAAFEYWQRTSLLFGLLASKNDRQGSTS